MRKFFLTMSLLAICLGCSRGQVSNNEVPTFSLCWNEYPSWSTFGVADAKGIIDGDAGQLGPIEKKWNVDIVLKQADYDTCITLYGNNAVDAACLTSLDSLAPGQSRDSVIIGPTSTSVGADACIVVGGIDSIENLKKVGTYGLDKSVSRYVFNRVLEKNNFDPKDFVFKNMDPGTAAQAMQTNQDGIVSIMVWNPFVLQTLRTRDDSKVLFSSDVIPEEVVDCIVMGKDSLNKPGGEAFACAVLDAFYEVNKLIANPETHDETLVAIGEKFSSLGLEDMEIVVEQTRFYDTPEKALTLFNDPKFRNETTPLVVDFCVSQEIVDGKPSVGFNDDGASLNFTTKYLEKVK